MASLTSIDDTLSQALEILHATEVMLEKLDGELFGYKPQSPSQGGGNEAPMPSLSERMRGKAHLVVSSAERLQDTVKSLTNAVFGTDEKIRTSGSGALTGISPGRLADAKSLDVNAVYVGGRLG